MSAGVRNTSGGGSSGGLDLELIWTNPYPASQVDSIPMYSSGGSTYSMYGQRISGVDLDSYSRVFAYIRCSGDKVYRLVELSETSSSSQGKYKDAVIMQRKSYTTSDSVDYRWSSIENLWVVMATDRSFNIGYTSHIYGIK